jgi:uncharacterized protein (DUF488 family)
MATEARDSGGHHSHHGRIFTVGHSNHTEPGFFALLTRAGVNGVIDVRSVPHSKRFPHFGHQSLQESCAKVR